MNDDRATREDIRYAYRLIMGRSPDPQGLEAYDRLIRESHVRASELAEYFLGSNEFRARYNSELIEVALDGFVVLVRADDGDVGKSIAKTRSWEENVTSVLRGRLGPGDVFLDVGANIGYFTAFAANAVTPTGRVIAVEPMDKNLQLIYAMIERNQFANVRIHPFAAADEQGIVGMETHPGSSNGEVVRDWKRGQRPLYAQARRLDDLLGDVRRIDIVKFDIEGHEMRAWRGFETGLRRHRPIVLTEFHPKCMRDNANVDPAAYGALLLQYGDVTVLSADGVRTPCADCETLMRIWAREDTTLRTDGGAHLDLLVEPRS